MRQQNATALQAISSWDVEVDWDYFDDHDHLFFNVCDNLFPERDINGDQLIWPNAKEILLRDFNAGLRVFRAMHGPIDDDLLRCVIQKSIKRYIDKNPALFKLFSKSEKALIKRFGYDYKITNVYYKWWEKKERKLSKKLRPFLNQTPPRQIALPLFKDDGDIPITLVQHINAVKGFKKLVYSCWDGKPYYRSNSIDCSMQDFEEAIIKMGTASSIEYCAVEYKHSRLEKTFQMDTVLMGPAAMFEFSKYCLENGVDLERFDCERKSLAAIKRSVYLSFANIFMEEFPY